MSEATPTWQDLPAVLAQAQEFLGGTEVRNVIDTGNYDGRGRFSAGAEQLHTNLTIATKSALKREQIQWLQLDNIDLVTSACEDLEVLMGGRGFVTKHRHQLALPREAIVDNLTGVCIHVAYGTRHKLHVRTMTGNATEPYTQKPVGTTHALHIGFTAPDDIDIDTGPGYTRGVSVSSALSRRALLDGDQLNVGKLVGDQWTASGVASYGRRRIIDDIGAGLPLEKLHLYSIIRIQETGLPTETLPGNINPVARQLLSQLNSNRTAVAQSILRNTQSFPVLWLKILDEPHRLRQHAKPKKGPARNIVDSIEQKLKNVEVRVLSGRTRVVNDSTVNVVTNDGEQAITIGKEMLFRSPDITHAMRVTVEGFTELPCSELQESHAHTAGFRSLDDLKESMDARLAHRSLHADTKLLLIKFSNPKKHQLPQSRKRSH